MKKILATITIALLPTIAQADAIYQESAVDLCQNMKQQTYSSKCLAMVKKAIFNEGALGYCKDLGAWNKTKTCLELIKNNEYEEKPLSICKSAKYYNNDLKKCFKEIANKHYVSEIEVGLCEKEKTYPKKVKCLKTATNKPYSERPKETEEKSSETIATADLKAKVKQAYELLKQNKSTEATLVLHDLVKQFEK